MTAPAFLAVWPAMMAVMMVPSEAAFASRYARVHPRHVRALCLFLVGYVGVWALTALPALGFLRIGEAVSSSRPALRAALAVTAFACLAVYELSSLKVRCLRRCRPPFSLLLRYSSWEGRLRSVAAGAHHALFCVGCCFALMVMLVTLGFMGVVAMTAAACVVAAEKLSSRGLELSKVVGFVALGLAVTAVWLPPLRGGSM